MAWAGNVFATTPTDMNRCTFFSRHEGNPSPGETCKSCKEIVKAIDIEHGGLFNRKRKEGTGQNEHRLRLLQNR